MASLDTVSIAILLGSLLVLAGILSSLIALRFGAPLLLVFLLVGMLAGEGGPGGIKFDNVGAAYTGRLDRAGADPVRRRPAHPARDLPQRAGAGGDAGDRRRADHRAADRAGRQMVLGIGWMRGAAGRRGGGLDRRGGGVLPDQRARPAAAPARARDARGRVRHQRSVRGVPDPAAGRVSCCAGEQSWSHAFVVLAARHAFSAASSAMAAAGSSLWCSTGSSCRRACTRRSSRSARWWCSPSRNAVHASGFLAVYLAGLVVGNRADPRAQFGGGVSRRRHLAGADRDVRAARPAGLAGSAGATASSARSSSRWC